MDDPSPYEQLRRCEQLLEALPAAIYMTDAEGYITFYNQAAVEFAGRKPELGKDRWCITWRRYWPDGTPMPEDQVPLATALKENRPIRGVEGILERPDGTRIHVAPYPTPLYDSSGALIGAVNMLVDITERKHAEEVQRRLDQERLRQAQKMAAIGQHTAGIAHDFNNLLFVITGNLKLLLERLPADGTKSSVLRRLVATAAHSAQQAEKLTRQLLAFSHPRPLQSEPIDVNSLVVRVSELLRRTLGDGITVETVLDSGLEHVEGDPSQIENALLNLALNARDAMADGGTLTIETAAVDLGECLAVTTGEVPPGQYARLAVRDTGVGMPPDIAACVFEPFFTTKPPGHGTGLGLSQVYGFVKQSGGHAEIRSEPGKGTCVALYLPRRITTQYRNADHTGPADTSKLVA